METKYLASYRRVIQINLNNKKPFELLFYHYFYYCSIVEQYLTIKAPDIKFID